MVWWTMCCGKEVDSGQASIASSKSKSKHALCMIDGIRRWGMSLLCPPTVISMSHLLRHFIRSDRVGLKYFEI